MSFQEQFEQLENAGNVTDVTYSIKTWEAEGDRLIGVIRDIVPFEGGRFDSHVNSYLIETDTGLVSTVLGAATDKQVEPLQLKGQLVCITFHGKKPLDDGRSVNVFSIKVAS